MQDDFSTPEDSSLEYVSLFNVVFNSEFYSTAFKGCAGVVFTHGVWMGGWVCCGKKLVRAVSHKL